MAFHFLATLAWGFNFYKLTERLSARASDIESGRQVSSRRNDNEQHDNRIMGNKTQNNPKANFVCVTCRHASFSY